MKISSISLENSISLGCDWDKKEVLKGDRMWVHVDVYFEHRISFI